MNRMQGKFALITGGATGIGLATAKMLATEGARVAINGIDQKQLDEALAQLPAGSLGILARVERMTDLDAMMDKVKAEFGTLDTLVLCAGVMKVKPLKELAEADFDEHFGVNVKGTLFAVQKASAIMRRGGSIVLIASGTIGMGRVGRTLYAATKSAVRSLARSLAAELVHAGIRVNAVSPGPIMTPMNMVAERTTAQQAEFLGKMVPIGRVGLPEDVAASILFLASDESSFVLGADLAVDGGWAQLLEVPKPPAHAA
jgi:NAD(P)-dependent dehydrogenase (short-subunit alcohol dehydrogenase family)